MVSIGQKMMENNFCFQSVYDPDSCMNLITHLGFGHGNFQFGDHASADMQVSVRELDKRGRI